MKREPIISLSAPPDQRKLDDFIAHTPSHLYRDHASTHTPDVLLERRRDGPLLTSYNFDTILVARLALGRKFHLDYHLYIEVAASSNGSFLVLNVLGLVYKIPD